jgi:hypothetical protein
LLLLALFYQKYRKISSFIVAFTYLLFSLVRMSNPKVEVRTFKQQGERVWKMLGTVLAILIIGVRRSILPWSSLEIFMLVYLVGIGTFLILLQA